MDRFGKDSLIALATVEEGIPYVRTVDTVYGEWFTAHGMGENLGHVLLPENQAIMEILRAAFAVWYDNGHSNEADPNTCLLKIKLTDSVLFSDGTRYDIDFAS
jgi:hypothetical protein